MAVLLLNHWSNPSPLHFGTQVPYNVEVEPPPPGLQTEFETLLSTEVLQFLSDLCCRFQPEVDKVKRWKTKRWQYQWYYTPHSTVQGVYSLECIQFSILLHVRSWRWESCERFSWISAKSCRVSRRTRLTSGTIRPGEWVPSLSDCSADMWTSVTFHPVTRSGLRRPSNQQRKEYK